MSRLVLELLFVGLALLAVPGAWQIFGITTRPAILKSDWLFWSIGLSGVLFFMAWIFAVGFLRTWFFWA